MNKVVEGLPFWSSFEVLSGQHWIGREFNGRGDLEFEGRLRFGGDWKGRLIAQSPDGHLHVLRTASISGVVKVPQIVVEGRLDDVDLDAERVHVLAGARVSGRIRARTLVIEEGALVSGRLSSRDEGYVPRGSAISSST